MIPTAMIPTALDLATAYAVTRRATLMTPLLDSEALRRATGAAHLWVKAENLQRAGSFKLRGATWRLTTLTAAERAKGVVAYSSGNFAQGLAAAGRDLGVPVTIVMPDDAPRVKRTATTGFGARVVLSHHADRPREEAALNWRRRSLPRKGWCCCIRSMTRASLRDKPGLRWNRWNRWAACRTRWSARWAAAG